jgi:hypothetical protein
MTGAIASDDTAARLSNLPARRAPRSTAIRHLQINL